MDRKKEEIFRKFEGRLKISVIRARYANDERAAEYSDILEKIETIKERRYFSLTGGQNEEKQLYSQLLDITGIDFNKDDEFQGMLESVKELLSDYKVDKKEKELGNDGEER